jgi:exodeoxyribonuclease V alpha subunit
MTTLAGIVSDVTFRNDDSGFCVIRLQTDDRPAPVICVGAMPTLEPGESATLTGEFQLHPRFGSQFNVEKYEITRPATERAVAAYLGSGIFSSIGASRAKKIVATFGVATLDILDTKPQRLLEIPGIGRKTLEKIIAGWKKQASVRNLMLFLSQFGVTPSFAAKIHAAYGDKAQEIISQNPYQLIDDIWGVGFKKADAIARRAGYQRDSYRRVRAGLLFVVQEALADGHVYLPVDEVTSRAANVLEAPPELCVFSLDQMVAARDAINDGGRIYLPQSFAVENAVAEMLRARISRPDTGPGFPEGKFESWLASYSIRTGWSGDPKQTEAIKAALTKPIFLLTGGPGTGKTTTLQVIVSFLREHSVTVALAAPTGRAAQRMGEVAGIAAQTIHRLLEFRPKKGGFFFARNAQNPVPARVVILDEVSMVDIFLFRSLLSAIGPDTRIMFVGDNNQLPSVGPGSVLADLIASRKIPHVHLTAIFRQAQKSAIVRAAHQIIGGTTPKFANDKDDDCFFLVEEDEGRCCATVVDVVASRLPRRYGFDAIADIQVLSPMHKGVLGTQHVNSLLQEALNPGRARLVRGERAFSPGDKVMQVRNNYDLGVFNGDIGYVTDIVDGSSLVVDFDGQRIAYNAAALDELVPAYCISIHKSQGCEFKAVVIILATQHYIMLQRNLAYTALTRARKLCVFIGAPRALSVAVQNDQALRRYSWLAQRLTGALSGKETT